MTMADPSQASTSFSNGLTPLQEECFKLLKAKQYKSCEILARMELAKAELEGRDSRVAWALLGDCAQLTQQYRRAISYYRRIQVFGSYKYRLKEAQCLQGNDLTSSIVAMLHHFSLISQYLFLLSRNLLKTKALGNVVEASSVLEVVPKEFRTLTMSMTLAKVRQSNFLMCCFG